MAMSSATDSSTTVVPDPDPCRLTVTLGLECRLTESVKSEDTAIYYSFTRECRDSSPRDARSHSYRSVRGRGQAGRFTRAAPQHIHTVLRASRALLTHVLGSWAHTCISPPRCMCMPAAHQGRYAGPSMSISSGSPACLTRTTPVCCGDDGTPSRRICTTCSTGARHMGHSRPFLRRQRLAQV